MSRVLITGMGAITAAGASTNALVEAMRSGNTCIDTVRLFPASDLDVRIAGEVTDLPPMELVARNHAERTSRSDHLAVVATTEALQDAGLATDTIDPDRFGVAIGSSTGGMFETESYFAALMRKESLAPHRKRILAATVGASADLLANVLGARGRRLAPSTACSSSALAIAMGKVWIQAGHTDVVVAGGTDALCRMTFSGFQSLKAMSPTPCQPFDINRTGLSLGEGAGIVILESEEHATHRGARPLAEVAGAGISCDAAHPTAPHAESRGAILALAKALEEADLKPNSVDYINAHGTGTPQNDVAEARAIHQVFGKAAESCPVSSTKGLLGHLLGAAGSVEAILCVLAMREGFLPPQVGLEEPDPECNLALIRKPLSARPKTAVSNSYGFGGNNVSLALRAT